MANSKINGSELNNTTISLEVLKSSDVGDMVLICGKEGSLALFTVAARVTTRGAKGGTALTLSNVHTEEKLELASTASLPEGTAMVRKVLSGVNVRTLRKIAPATIGPVVSTEVALPILDLTGFAEVAASEPVATVSGEMMQVASCDAEDDIDALIAECLK